MSEKNISRIRRAKKSRIHIRDQESPRLTVFRSSKHFYAQIFDSLGAKVIVSASTAEKDIDAKSNNLDAAVAVGKKVAERALESGIKKVVFDNSVSSGGPISSLSANIVRKVRKFSVMVVFDASSNEVRLSRGGRYPFF